MDLSTSIATGLTISKAWKSKWRALTGAGRLTSTTTELRVDMQDFEGSSAYAQYTSFSVGDSSFKYVLTVSSYSGTVGYSLTYHNRQKFTTRDQDSDADSRNCAQLYKGGWWYYACYGSNLNGLCGWCQLVHMEGILLLPRIH